MLEALVTIFGILVTVLLWVILYDSNRFAVRRHTVTDRRIRKRCRAVVLADLHNKGFSRLLRQRQP